MSYLEDYYTNTCNEDGRLLSRHGQVEYLTTRKYIDEVLARVPDAKILEIGAATGRYSVTLAKEGYRVTAVELVPHNLEILKSKLDGTEDITVLQGNALDLSALPDGKFDLTLVFGPMYHLYTFDDQRRALTEAIRVTKPGGTIMVAYCMNDATVVQFAFGGGHTADLLERNMLTDEWHCISEPKDLFMMVRTEEIAAIDEGFPVERLKLIATDGATNYMREVIDAMDDETFSRWLDYHFKTCERADLVGASHHTMDILKKL